MIWKDPRKCGPFLRLSLPCQRQAPPLRGRWRVAPEGDLVARRAGGIPTGFPGNLNTPAWITEDGMHVNEKFERYARPLIQAELSPIYINGVPRHIHL